MSSDLGVQSLVSLQSYMQRAFGVHRPCITTEVHVKCLEHRDLVSIKSHMSSIFEVKRPCISTMGQRNVLGVHAPCNPTVAHAKCLGSTEPLYLSSGTFQIFMGGGHKALVSR